MARGVRDDEAAARRGEVAVGHVDRDALLPLGLEPVREQGQVDRVAVEPPRIAVQGGELVVVDRLAVAQQAPDERRLAVVDAARSGEAQQLRLAVGLQQGLHILEPVGVHQK